MSAAHPQELAKFNELAARWWDPDGPMKPLHQLNPLRLEFITSHVAVESLKIADIGCGGGILSEALAKAGAKVTAIDLSEKLIATASDHAEKSGLTIDYQCKPVAELAASAPGVFDAVVCYELLEHVPHPDEFVQHCASLVKPGGHVFFSTINRNVWAFAKAIVAAEYILGLLPKGTHHYSQFIKPSELTAWATRADLILQDCRGIDYQPFSGAVKFTKNIDTNYLIYFVKEK